MRIVEKHKIGAEVDRILRDFTDGPLEGEELAEVVSHTQWLVEYLERSDDFAILGFACVAKLLEEKSIREHWVADGQPT